MTTTGLYSQNNLKISNKKVAFRCLITNNYDLGSYFLDLKNNRKFIAISLYRNDISLKSSNVKLNINDVCNLIER